MVLCGDDQDHKRLLARIRRIEGQMRGLAKMVEDDADCMLVMTQAVSAMGAMKGVWLQILEDHIHGCVRRAVLDGGKDDDLVHELVGHIKKFS